MSTDLSPKTPDLQNQDPNPVADKDLPETPSKLNDNNPLSPGGEPEQRGGSTADVTSPPAEEAAGSSSKSPGFFGRAKGLTGSLFGTVGGLTGKGVDLVDNTLPVDLSILKGLTVGGDGGVVGQDGKVLGKLVEGNPADLVGSVVGEKGEVLGEDGGILGRVEALPEAVGDAAGQATGDKDKGLPDTVGDTAGGALDTVGNTAGGAVDTVGQTTGGLLNTVGNTAGGVLDTVGQTTGLLSKVAGLPINPEGLLKDTTGAVVGKVTEGNPEELAGKAPNEEGEIRDEEGSVIGRVEPTSLAGRESLPDTQRAASTADSASGSLAKGLGQSGVGSVGDAAGSVGDAAGSVGDIAGSATSAVGDSAGDIQNLPPISDLEGLKCNKLGKIIDASTGKPIGELIEGDAKKLAALGTTLDDKGQFWDNRGNVIGKAQTIPVEEHADEPIFAGLEGLHVVEDGWVEDNKGKRVGQIVDGDAKKILGRPVDEDGEVTDQHGNVIAKAEYYEAPDEPEAEVTDLSHLNGLKPNKMGLVIGSNGVPIARVVEGNPKELAGKEIEDGQVWDGRKSIGRVELIPDNEREKKPEGLFAGLDGLVVNQDGFVEDSDGNVVGQVTEGDAKALRGRSVDEDGDILDKFGSVKGHAERYEPPEEEVVEEDLSLLEGKTVNKAGNVVDAQGTIFGRIVSGDGKKMAGRKVDGKGQIWGDNGKVIGKAELVPGAEQGKPEGPFYGFESAEVGKDGVVADASGRIIGRVVDGDAKKLFGRKVDEDGDILDKNGNTIGHAERWEPEEKKRNVNPMAGRKVTREGEVRDTDGNLIGKLTSGNLPTLIGKEIDDNGNVVDNDGNKLGECTLLEHIPEPEPEEEPGPTPEEIEAQKKSDEEQKKIDEDRKLAKKMSAIVTQTLDRMHPICKMITEHVEKAERTPKEELDEEQVVQNVKPLLEEGNSILTECNGAIRALDPDGQIAATAKARAASHEASPEEYALADKLKELTDTVVRTVENGKKKIAGMPHAKKQLNPLWGLLSEPLFQIIAAVGMLLTGVLGLVGRLLDGLGLGPIVNRLLGGLGLDKILGSLGLGSVTDALGLTGKKK